MIGGSFYFKAEHKLSEFQALSAFKETETDGIKASARVSLISGMGKLVVGEWNIFKSDSAANYALIPISAV